jgi:hypothetical protein
MADSIGQMVLVGILILGFGFAALCFFYAWRESRKIGG